MEASLNEPYSEHVIDDLDNLLSILFFTFTLIDALFVFVRLKFHLDLAAMVISFSYLFSMFFRLPIFSSDDVNAAFWPALAQKLIWGSLYYFVFEMKKMEDKLKSETYEEHKRMMKKTKLVKWIVMSTFIIVIAPLEMSIYLFKIIDYRLFDDKIAIFNIVLFIRSLLKLIVDSYMYFEFFRVFRYFIDKKKQ